MRWDSRVHALYMCEVTLRGQISDREFNQRDYASFAFCSCQHIKKQTEQEIKIVKFCPCMSRKTIDPPISQLSDAHHSSNYAEEGGKESRVR